MGEKKFKSSRWSRLGKVGGTLARVAGGYALDRAQDLLRRADKGLETVEYSTQRIKAAQEIIRSMGELKGGLMKIGQMLSITEDLVLPKEITALFRTLQKEAPAMSTKELDQVFVKSFGEKPEKLFKKFNREPMAAASIGQVHEAILFSGERVAVKVQYPKIVRAMKSDLKNLDQLDRLFSALIPGKPNIKVMLQELRKSLLQECDYEREFKEMESFREIYREEFPEIHIPKPYKDFSSTTILTTEFVEGDSFEETLEKYTQEQKNELGEILYKSFLYSFYQKRKLHTDPQNGNYLFHPGKIILMDFGSTRDFSDDFVDNYALLQHAIEVSDLEVYRLACINLGLAQETDSEEHIQMHFKLVHDIYSPFLKHGKYSVDDLNPFRILKDFFETIELKGRKAPKQEFLLMDRANLGIFTKIKQWKAEVDWEKGREKYRYSISQKVLKKNQ